MRRDFSQTIRDLDDRDIYLPASGDQIAKFLIDLRLKLPDDLRAELDAAIQKELAKPLTLGTVCVNALLGAYADETALSDEDRSKRMALARKLHKGGEIDVSLDELARVKPLITKRYNGIVIPVIAFELLEGT